MDGRPLAAHGTRARYIHHGAPCRCPECTAANTRYIARWRQTVDTRRRIARGQLTAWPGPDAS